MASQFRGGGRGFLDLVQTLFHNASMIDFEPSSAKHRVIGFPRNGRGDEANDSTTMVGYQPNPPPVPIETEHSAWRRVSWYAGF